MMTRKIRIDGLKFSLLMFALLAGMAFAADCGQGIKACECGDTMMASYTMSSDLICDGNTNGIAIGANGVTLDCANHKIQTRWKYDVLIGDGRSNIIVKNCVLVGACGYDGGSSFSGGANILIVDGNAAYNANQPLTGASNIQVLDSRTESFTVGPQGGGWTHPCAGRSIESFFSSGITITNFSMLGGEQPGIFLFTCHDNIMTNISGGGYDGIYLQGSWNNQIKNSNVNAGMQGIAVYNYNSQCSNNTVVNTGSWGGGSSGISVGGSCDNNKIINSSFSSGGGPGMRISSSNNQIINNNASSYWQAALSFSGGSNNIVTGGVYKGTVGYSPQYIQCGNYDPYGIAFYSSSGNTITNSTISTGSANTPLNCGIAVRVHDAASSGNMIYNNVINSPALLSLGDGAGTQIWDNGVTGNYYINPSNTGYSQTCAATANTCTTPLTLGGSNIDNKPLKNIPSWFVAVLPTCSDGIKNQAESDIDCGGPCIGCTIGKTCTKNGDCMTNRCFGGVCRQMLLPEDCGNDVDDDDDGLTDCADTDCISDPACPPELVQDTTGGTVTAQNATVTIPAGALATTELLVTIVPSTHSFGTTTSTGAVFGQPLDIGPQCSDISSQSTCQSTNGCQWDGACSFIRFESPVTITMPGDCSGTKKVYQQKIGKWNGVGWPQVLTCNATITNLGGGLYRCTAADGRNATWNQNTCMMSVQTWTFSTYAVIGSSVQYCSTQQLQTEGTYTVNYRATDTYGNTASGSDTLKIDLYPPSTLAQLTGVMGDFGWYTSDVVVDFIASDSMSGVNATYYSLDNVAWSTWAGADTLAVSGISTIYYYSEDNAGLKEEVKSVHVTVDKTEPVISVTEAGTEGNAVIGGDGASWWISILNVNIDATDSESGIMELCSALGVEPEECVQAPE